MKIIYSTLMNYIILQRCVTESFNFSDFILQKFTLEILDLCYSRLAHALQILQSLSTPRLSIINTFLSALNRRRSPLKLRGKLQSFTLVAVVKSRSFQSLSALRAYTQLPSLFFQLTIRSKDLADRPRRSRAGLISNHYLDTGCAINYCVLERASSNLGELFPPFHSLLSTTSASRRCATRETH